MSHLDNLNRIKSSCRICLSNSKNNICLNKALNKKKSSPSILQALERIMTIKIKLDDNLPFLICPTCLSSVNSSYELIEQFEKTQKQLNVYFSKSNVAELVIRNEMTFANNKDGNILSEDITLENPNSVVICKDDNMEYIEYTDAEYLNDYLVSESEEEDVEENLEYSNVNIYNSNKRKNHEVELKLEIMASKDYRKITKNMSTIVNDLIIEKPAVVEYNSTSQVCDEIFQAASNLQYSCTSCPKIYSSLRNLEKHQKNCAKFLEIPTAEQKVYEELTSDCLSELDRELFRNALLLKYECERCSKVYSSIGNLKKHQTVCRRLYKPLKNKVQCKRNEVEINAATLLANLDKSKKFHSIEQVDVNNLSQIEKEIFMSALKLRHECIYCHNFFSSEKRYQTHEKNCRAKKKLGVNK